MIKYEHDPEIGLKVSDIARRLEMAHIDLTRVKCYRSVGSTSRGTIARCYALSKIWQQALNTKAHYIIEIISERFDKLPEDEKEKVLIHELLHIPQSFGGGFRHHDFVCRRNVENLYKQLKSQF